MGPRTLRNALLGATALIGSIALAQPAHAVLQFSALINGVTVSCSDGAACDTSPTAGTLTIANQTIGGVQFNGSAQTQTVGSSNILDTSSFQIINTNAGTVNYQIAIGGTNFTGPVTQLQESGAGTWTNAAGSTIDMRYWADVANGQGADTPIDFPGLLQADSGILTATGQADSIAFNHVSAFSDTNLYSMTLGTSGSIIGGGRLTGRSQTIVATNAVPEPASLAIIGAGMVGLGMVKRRRKTTDQNLIAA